MPLGIIINDAYFAINQLLIAEINRSKYTLQVPYASYKHDIFTFNLCALMTITTHHKQKQILSFTNELTFSTRRLMFLLLLCLLLLPSRRHNLRTSGVCV